MPDQPTDLHVEVATLKRDVVQQGGQLNEIGRKVDILSDAVQGLVSTFKSNTGRIDVRMAISVTAPIVMFIAAIAAIYVNPIRNQVDTVTRTLENYESQGGSPAARIHFAQNDERQSWIERRQEEVLKRMAEAEAAQNRTASHESTMAQQLDDLREERRWDKQKAAIGEMMDSAMDRLRDKK